MTKNELSLTKILYYATLQYSLIKIYYKQNNQNSQGKENKKNDRKRKKNNGNIFNMGMGRNTSACMRHTHRHICRIISTRIWDLHGVANNKK